MTPAGEQLIQRRDRQIYGQSLCPRVARWLLVSGVLLAALSLGGYAALDAGCPLALRSRAAECASGDHPSATADHLTCVQRTGLARASLVLPVPPQALSVTTIQLALFERSCSMAPPLPPPNLLFSAA